MSNAVRCVGCGIVTTTRFKKCPQCGGKLVPKEMAPRSSEPVAHAAQPYRPEVEVPEQAPPAPVPAPAPSATPLSIDERRARLDREVSFYVGRGFRVISRMDTTAQLVEPKQLSCLFAALWFFLGLGFGLLIYLLYYVAKRDTTVYLEIDNWGRIHRQEDRDQRAIMIAVVAALIVLACVAFCVFGGFFSALLESVQV